MGGNKAVVMEAKGEAPLCFKAISRPWSKLSIWSDITLATKEEYGMQMAIIAIHGPIPNTCRRSKPQINSWILLGIANILLIRMAFHWDDSKICQKVFELITPRIIPPNVLITQLSNAVAMVICRPFQALRITVCSSDGCRDAEKNSNKILPPPLCRPINTSVSTGMSASAGKMVIIGVEGISFLIHLCRAYLCRMEADCGLDNQKLFVLA